MANRSFYPRILIIFGLALFIFGLLAILQEKTLFSAIMQIAPNTQTATILGAVIVSVGQAIVVFGAVRIASGKLLSSMETERQLMMAVFAKNVEQFQIKLQNERQSMVTGYNQVLAKLDGLISNQRESNAGLQSISQANCKYCGATIEQGSFCVKCGKSNR